MAALRHIHTYVRYKHNPMGKPGFYKCIDPDCTHFIDKGMLLGKRCLCPSCSNEFIMTREHLRRVRPLCIDCSNTKESRRMREMKVIARTVFDRVEAESVNNEISDTELAGEVE